MSQAASSSQSYLNSNLFSGYYLDKHVAGLDAWDCDKEAQTAFEQLQQCFRQEGKLLSSYKEEDVLNKWIDEVLTILGFDSLSETNLTAGRGEIDRTLFSSSQDRIDAAHLRQDGDLDGMYGRSVALLEAKKWDTDFSKHFNEGRQYRDASHQIKFYLERTPEDVKWGILTDGRKWRLYGTKDYETQTYYEIDLPELLKAGNVEQFKYFYVFFRAAAFEEIGGTTFLEEVWNESETAAQELGEDLQDNVFTALRVLGEGFVETNKLKIEPNDDAGLNELKEQSLVLLYRLMFILYAESRGLIDPDEPRAEDEYRSNFSLEVLRNEILEEIDNGRGFDEVYSSYSTTMWSRMEDLFRLIDNGAEELGIPAYNGGLFDREQHAFLTENEISNRHLAEVVYRLSTTEAEDGSYVPADYADLDTRHLGSIYEGLLEHEFRITPEEYAAVSENGDQVWKPATAVSVADAVESVEQGELYVVNDEGERKATGTYYTPDTVVTYIVEKTIDPLLEEVKAAIQEEGIEPGTEAYVYAFADRILELKVLDPAMGSGHFLTKATGYLADAVMQEVRKVEKVAGVFDEQEVRRRVSKECIYGVDLNGMAVELAKLSMWLETLATDQPLAFLDHHLKEGNSLIGSDITEVLSDDPVENGGQLTLRQAFARVRRNALDHVMDLVQKLLAYDNETLEDIKSMEALYAEIRSDPLYERLFEIANVHTAERFGADIPQDAYGRMADAIEDEDKWTEIAGEDWFVSSQAAAGEEAFFHWELEFPEVFFGIDGEKREDAGFDAVIGNPPYGANFQPRHQKYLREHYLTANIEYDSYTIFMEKQNELLNNKGSFGYIVPISWTKLPTDKSLRKELLTKYRIYDIVDCGQVFKSAVVETLLISARKCSNNDNIDIRIIEKDGTIEDRLNRLGSNQFESEYSIDQSVFIENKGMKLNYDSSDLTVQNLIEKIESDSIDLEKICDVSQGVTAYDRHAGQDPEIIENRAFHSDKKEDETYGKWLDGKDVQRYHLNWKGEWLSYGDWLSRPREEKYFTDPRLLFREVTGGINRVIAAYTEEEFYYGHSVIPAITTDTHLKSHTLLALVNSKLLSYYNLNVSPNAQKNTFPKMNPDDVRALPIYSDISENSNEELAESTRSLLRLKQNYHSLNLSLLDHLGNYREGVTLIETGITQPSGNAADSILNETTESKPNLRIGRIKINRESETTLEILMTVRYKPENEENYETDRWDFTETDYLSAFKITDLTEQEADLIRHFIPIAVKEGDGFAGFRKNATKNISPIDRVKTTKLPDVDDVETDLENYLQTLERAEELDEQMKKTERFIDERVYELYELTDEEIEMVEQAIDGSYPPSLPN